ncbi:hypothetical protein CR513_14232, partial [Mucuna pruriens]
DAIVLTNEAITNVKRRKTSLLMRQYEMCKINKNETIDGIKDFKLEKNNIMLLYPKSEKPKVYPFRNHCPIKLDELYGSLRFMYSMIQENEAKKNTFIVLNVGISKERSSQSLPKIGLA